MKYLPLVLLTLAAIGCGHSEFDVDEAQVNRHKAASKPAGSGPSHLPPEPAKPPMKVKPGDRLPDGTIADHAGTVSSDGR